MLAIAAGDMLSVIHLLAIGGATRPIVNGRCNWPRVFQAAYVR